MKKHWMQIAVVVLACVAWESSAQEKSVAVDEFVVNGLKVLVKPVSANDIISVQLYLRGGCMNLTEATQGIEHLLLQSALKGSTNYPKEQLNAVLDRTASAITGASTRNYSKVTLRCLKSDIDMLWDVFADVIMRPAFVPEDVEVVRNNILLGIRQRKDNPDSYLAMVSDEGFYAGHPYRFEPEGVEGSMSALTIEQMKKYLTDNLVTSKLLLVVVGNMSKEDVRKKVEATFGKLPQGQYKPVFPPPVVHATPSMKVIEQQMPDELFPGDICAARSVRSGPPYDPRHDERARNARLGRGADEAESLVCAGCPEYELLCQPGVSVRYNGPSGQRREGHAGRGEAAAERARPCQRPEGPDHDVSDRVHARPRNERVAGRFSRIL